MAEFASNGKANAGLATGIIGTSLAGLLTLGSGAGLFGVGGNGNSWVSHKEFEKQNEISALESKISLLEAEKDSEKKMIDVYERVTARILENERSYANDKAAQQVINAQVGAQIAVNTGNIQQLMAMTKLVIPSGNVCPNPMPLYNNWKAPEA